MRSCQAQTPTHGRVYRCLSGTGSVRCSSWILKAHDNKLLSSFSYHMWPAWQGRLRLIRTWSSGHLYSTKSGKRVEPACRRSMLHRRLRIIGSGSGDFTTFDKTIHILRCLHSQVENCLELKACAAHASRSCESKWDQRSVWIFFSQTV